MGPEKRFPEAANDQPVGRAAGVQRSERRRGEAVRAAGRWRSDNRPRLALASPLIPHVRTVGSSLEAHARRGRGKAEAVAIPTGAAVRIAGPPGDAGKVRPTARPNKSLSRKPRPRGVGKGIQDLTEPVWVEHPPQEPNFFLLALSSCDRKPAGGTRGARERTRRQTADEIFNPLSTSSPLPGILRWSTLPSPRDVSVGDPKGRLKHAPAPRKRPLARTLTWKIGAGATTDVGPSPSQGCSLGAVELKIGAEADC